MGGVDDVDPAGAIASKGCRWAVWLAFCQALQMCMSYTGGALPVCVDDIVEQTGVSWTNSELGLLGSMDVLGTTLVSVACGAILQRFSVKGLLLAGLAVNVAATLGFSMATSKVVLLLMRLITGAAQALQMVWATVWTIAMAPPGRKAVWMGCGAIAAGLGNGIGSIVAGVALSQPGGTFALPFQVQAAAFGAFLVGMLAVPARTLAGVTATSTRVGCDPEGSTDTALIPPHPGDRQAPEAGACELLGNQLFFWTCLALSLVFFAASGIQYVWVRVLTKVWGLGKDVAAANFIALTGAGGGVAILFGPAYIDHIGGFSGPAGVRRCLDLLLRTTTVAGAAGVAGALFLWAKVLSPDAVGSSALPLYAAVFVLAAANNFGIAALVGINVESVPEELRSLAFGVEMTVRNLLGYACGPLLPGIAMDVAKWCFGWTDGPEDAKRVVCFGLAFVLLLTMLGVPILLRARAAATPAGHEPVVTP